MIVLTAGVTVAGTGAETVPQLRAGKNSNDSWNTIAGRFVRRAVRSQSRLRVSNAGHFLEWRGQPILPIGDSVTHGWMTLIVGWNPKCGMAGQVKLRAEAYDILGQAARFFNRSGVTFWRMAPHPELASTGRCLAQPGVEYVVYAPTGDVSTVNLSAARDKLLAVRWYNPRAGRFHSAPGISGGNASARFQPPFVGDAVLHLIARTSESQLPDP